MIKVIEIGSKLTDKEYAIYEAVEQKDWEDNTIQMPIFVETATLANLELQKVKIQEKIDAIKVIEAK